MRGRVRNIVTERLGLALIMITVTGALACATAACEELTYVGAPSTQAPLEAGTIVLDTATDSLSATTTLDVLTETDDDALEEGAEEDEEGAEEETDGGRSSTEPAAPATTTTSSLVFTPLARVTTTTTVREAREYDLFAGDNGRTVVARVGDGVCIALRASVPIVGEARFVIPDPALINVERNYVNSLGNLIVVCIPLQPCDTDLRVNYWNSSGRIGATWQVHLSVTD